MIMTYPGDTVKFKHKIQSLVVFIVALNALALFYVLFNAKSGSMIDGAKIAALVDKIESVIPEPYSSPADTTRAVSSPEPRLAPDQATAAAPSLAAAAPARAPAPILAQILPSFAPNPAPVAQALTMVSVAPISVTGACLSIDGFKNNIQAESAKAVLASSPLRDKSWTVSTPYAAQYIAGVDTAGLASSRRVSRMLSLKGVEPLSTSAKFIVLARSDNEASALELANASTLGIEGLNLRAIMVSSAATKQSLVTLPQTRSETQFAASLSSRLPGVSISAVPCPPAARPFLAR